MEDTRKKAYVLLAEDDDDDFFLLKDAFKESGFRVPLQRVKDGEDLMKFLRNFEATEDLRASSLPSLILLDLNMPKKDGREALREIKSDPLLKKIPVIVLTTSRSPEDILKTYDAGANAFIRKPVRFEELVRMLKDLERFWFGLCELPAALRSEDL